MQARVSKIIRQLGSYSISWDWVVLGYSVQATSAAELQQAAMAMIQESAGHASTLNYRIASAGSCGRHRQNVARDISRAINLPLDTCLAYVVMKNYSVTLDNTATSGYSIFKHSRGLALHQDSDLL